MVRLNTNPPAHIVAEYEALLTVERGKGRRLNVYSWKPATRLPALNICEVRCTINEVVHLEERAYLPEWWWSDADYARKQIELFSVMAAMFDDLESEARADGECRGM